MPVSQELIDEAAAALGVTVTTPLAEGGQKTVLLVDDGGTERVMKVIANSSELPDGMKRATREVELLTSVDHPNVVKVASALIELGDPVAGATWLEQFLEGEDLDQVLTDRWDWDQAKQMALDVARGLSALHEKRVTHRDLSSRNIRVLSSGPYVVMDPGYARHTGRSSLTAAGQPGTPGFLSPEHLYGYSGAPTPASDVFCVGILIYLAVAGEQPIPYTGDLGEYATKLAAVEVTDIDAIRGDLPDAAKEVLMRCLHPQPARRYRNGAQLAEALEAT